MYLCFAANNYSYLEQKISHYTAPFWGPVAQVWATLDASFDFLGASLVCGGPLIAWFRAGIGIEKILQLHKWSGIHLPLHLNADWHLLNVCVLAAAAADGAVGQGLFLDVLKPGFHPPTPSPRTAALFGLFGLQNYRNSTPPHHRQRADMSLTFLPEDGVCEIC